MCASVVHVKNYLLEQRQTLAHFAESEKGSSCMEEDTEKVTVRRRRIVRHGEKLLERVRPLAEGNIKANKMVCEAEYYSPNGPKRIWVERKSDQYFVYSQLLKKRGNEVTLLYTSQLPVYLKHNGDKHTQPTITPIRPTLWDACMNYPSVAGKLITQKIIQDLLTRGGLQKYCEYIPEIDDPLRAHWDCSVQFVFELVKHYIDEATRKEEVKQARGLKRFKARIIDSYASEDFIINIGYKDIDSQLDEITHRLMGDL